MPNFTIAIKKPYNIIMCKLSVLLLFLCNIRGWQLIIILLVVMLVMVVPYLLGFVHGRGRSQKSRSSRRR